MRRLLPEPCLRENKVLWILWESWLSEFIFWLCHWFFPLAQTHGFPGTDMCLSYWDAVASLFYTGCLWSSHLATGFPPHVFQLPLCASHTFIFEAYQHCLLYFKCWYGWMTISTKMRATFSSFHSVDLTCHWLSDRPVWLPPQFFNVLSWSRQENDTWGIVLYD